MRSSGSKSFQNWQSEFMSTAVLVVLSIFLRHKGSPESKPAGAANSETGRLGFGGPLFALNQTVPEVIADVVVEEATFCERASKRSIDFGGTSS